MIDDPIVEEIRRIRIAHAAKYGNDFNRIFIAIKEAEKNYTDRLVDLRPMMQTLNSVADDSINRTNEN